MSQVTIKQLLEAGAHFGHQTQRWNPKMKKFIFGERNGIYIINLEITLNYLQKTLDFFKQVAKDGKEVLFVGTKKQAKDSVREAAERAEMPYVEQRWLGGMLTNFNTIRKSVARLEQIENMEETGNFQFITKKEAGQLVKEREKLIKNLKGIRNMRKLPGALFVIDSEKEAIAVHEAKILGIPVAAVIDTNSDPDKIDFPLPGNDDAIRSIRLFCDAVSQSVMDGRAEYKQLKAAQAQQEEEQAAANLAAQSVSVDGDAELPDTKEEKLAALFAEKKKIAEEEVGRQKIKKPLRKDGGKK